MSMFEEERFLVIKNYVKSGEYNKIKMCDLGDIVRMVSAHVELSVWADISKNESIDNLIKYCIKNNL